MENSSWNIAAPLPAAVDEEMGELTRLFGFNRSKAVMQDIVARPSCITPLILVCAVAMAYTLVASPHLTWDQTQIMLATAGTATAVLVRILVSAGLLTAFAAAVSKAPVSFGQVFAVVSYSRMPGVVFGVLAILLILFRRSAGLPEGNPMFTNLAVFLDPHTTSRFVYFLARSVDCVVFWELSLMALGLKAASRLSSTAANWGVVALWVVSALAQAAWVQWMAR